MKIGSYTNKEVLAPFAAIYGVGYAPLLILPFLFGAILDHFSVSEADGGLLITIELGAMCLGSLCIAPVIDRLSKKYVSIIGALIAVSGNLLLTTTDNFNFACIIFAVTGAGYGLAIAGGNAAVAAASDDSDKVYNRIILLGAVLMVLLLNLFPRLIAQWSLPGALVGLALLHLLMLPALFKLPSAKSSKTRDPEESTSQHNVLLQPIALVILAMIFFYFVRDTMIWVFAEDIGHNRLGMDPENIGLLFSIHGGMSLLGPLLLLWLMGKYRRSTLLFAGILATGLITVGISNTESILTYSLLAIVWSTAHFFTYGCIMGYATTADHTGRIAAATGAAVMGGNAIAPALAGYAVSSGGASLFSTYAIAAVAATLIFAGLTIFLSRTPNPSTNVKNHPHSHQ